MSFFFGREESRPNNSITRNSELFVRLGARIEAAKQSVIEDYLKEHPQPQCVPNPQEPVQAGNRNESE